MKLLNFKNLSDLKYLQAIGVNVEFTPEYEDIDPSELMDNEEAISKIYKDYEITPGFIHPSWFCAKVTVSFNRGEYSDECTEYLGGCSYRSFDEFTNADGDYYTDMISQCINEINTGIQLHNKDVQRLWDIRRAKNLINKYGLYITHTKEIYTL